MTQTPFQEGTGFDGLGLSQQILQTLKRMKISVPTPIQHQAIPPGLEGKDIMGIAQTGTGKTLAFGIPLVERLNRQPGRALVILPTRELAEQANAVFQIIGRVFNLYSTVLIGGASMGRQIQELRRSPRIIIATPGRLLDHMEQNTVRLNDVKILILDEADRMLDMGFAPQLNRILKTVPKARQTLLFSATMPHDIVKLATSHMSLPVRIEVAPSGTAASDIEQEIFIVRHEAKILLLERLLQQHEGTVLVFSRTKHGAKKITRILRSAGHDAAEIHSNRTQGQRREALEGFKSGRYRVLVATDIAARGIDVSGIAVVVNFDLPDRSEDYVHRIGRTGRAGKAGRAISFATPQQKGDIRTIERLLRKTLRVSPLPDLPTRPVDHDRPPQAPRQERPGDRGFRRSGGERSTPPRPAQDAKPFGKSRWNGFGGARRRQS